MWSPTTLQAHSSNPGSRPAGSVIYSMRWGLISPRLADIRTGVPLASNFYAMSHQSTRNLTVGSSYRCQFTWLLLSRLPRQRDSKPDFQVLGALLESDKIDPALPCHAFACQARQQQRIKPLLHLAFKVRSVEGSTARHEALDADAILHHHVYRQTTSLPQPQVDVYSRTPCCARELLLLPARTRRSTA